MDYQVIRYRSPLSDNEQIVIPELNFHCYPPAPTGRYELIQFPCPKCLDITMFFVIETKKGNKFFYYGTKYLILFCTGCDYTGKMESSEKGVNPWVQLSKMDLHNTVVDFTKSLNYSEREKFIQNIKTKYEIEK